MKFFKCEDFDNFRYPLLSFEICLLANRKLEGCLVLTPEELEKLPVVYGHKDPGPEDHPDYVGYVNFGEDNFASAHNDYSARLLDIQPLKPCDHEGYEAETTFKDGVIINREFRCKLCGVKLKAKWEPAEPA